MNVNIPVKYLIKYGMAHEGDTQEISMSYYGSEEKWLRQFLEFSDYIPNKIIEAQYIGEEPEDLTEIVQVRKSCRDRIKELEREE